MSRVEDFIDRFENDRRKLLLYLHEWLGSELELTAKIRYNIPFYYGRSWICYLNPTAKEAVELAFLRGNELSNEQGLLDNRGRKQVWGIEFRKVEEVPLELLEEILQEAILLDETIPYPSKRKS